MKKNIVVFLLLLISTNVYSQVNPVKKFLIYTSPLNAIDLFSRPMATIGGEYIAFNKIGLAVEYGHKFKDIDDHDFLVVDSKGYSFRSEIKLYDVNIIHSDDLRDYLSLEYRYIKDNYNSKFDYVTDSEHQTLVTDNYGILKNIYIGNVKFGLVLNKGKNVFFDFYTGVGFRYRDVTNVNRTFDENLGHEHKGAEFFWTISDFEEFSGLKFNFSLGLKVGIRI